MGHVISIMNVRTISVIATLHIITITLLPTLHKIGLGLNYATPS